jgi:hypothetical protein
LLFELKIRETAHRLRRHRRFRRLLEEAPVTEHRLVEPLLDLRFLQVRLHGAQIRERPLAGSRGAPGTQRRREHDRRG